jgi:hypothetical protein
VARLRRRLAGPGDRGGTDGPRRRRRQVPPSADKLRQVSSMGTWRTMSLAGRIILSYGDIRALCSRD